MKDVEKAQASLFHHAFASNYHLREKTNVPRHPCASIQKGCTGGWILWRDTLNKIVLHPSHELFKVHFGSRTVVHLFVDVDICDAAAQSLAMTNIASFSLVDAEARRIRISFQVLGKYLCTRIESVFVFFLGNW